eukprot:UN29195
MHVLDNLLKYVARDDDGELDLGEFSHWYCDLARLRKFWADNKEADDVEEKILSEYKLNKAEQFKEYENTAREIFDEFDDNENGLLDPDEVNGVYEWIWTQFKLNDDIEMTSTLRVDLQHSLRDVLSDEEELNKQSFVEWYSETA